MCNAHFDRLSECADARIEIGPALAEIASPCCLIAHIVKRVEHSGSAPKVRKSVLAGVKELIAALLRFACRESKAASQPNSTNRFELSALSNEAVFRRKKFLWGVEKISCISSLREVASLIVRTKVKLVEERSFRLTRLRIVGINQGGWYEYGS